MTNKLRSLKRKVEQEQPPNGHISVSLLTLLQSRDAVTALIVQKNTPARLAFRLGDVANAVSKRLEDLETQRKALVEKYGTPALTDDGKPNGFEIKPDSDALKSFQDEWNDLIALEVDLNVSTMKRDDIASLSLSGAEASVLGWLFTE